MSELTDPIEKKLLQAKEEANIPIDKLLKAVEGELIPRLMMSHLVDVPDSILGREEVERFSNNHWTGAASIEHFAQLCVDGESSRMRNNVDELIENGVSIETIYMLLLAPTAHHLGDRWLNDTLSFIDVHMSLLRLHQLIHSLELVGPVADSSDTKSILIAATPGDQHTFSATLVCDIFRRAGWTVANQSGQSEELLLQKIMSTDYAWIGFSLHNSESYGVLKNLIARVRKSISQDGPSIVVGGDYLKRHPEHMDALGADLCVLDGASAVEEVTQYMEKHHRLVR